MVFVYMDDILIAMSMDHVLHREIVHLLRFYGSALNAPGGPPGPSATAVAVAAAATVTPTVAVLVRAHFRWSHQIHRTGGLHGY
jgi:hypothetical protein